MDPDPDQVFKEPEVISNGSMAFDNTKVYDHISIFNGLVYETTGKKDPGRLSSVTKRQNIANRLIAKLPFSPLL